jgi:FecR protein
MTKLSRPTASAILSLMLAGATPLALGARVATDVDTPSATVGVSKVRIVRLSEVRGDVQIDLNSGSGFEKAMTNLPIVEQNRLRTGTGVAEVEFEDNSTLRLAPDTLVEFPQLELMASGAKASSVRVLKGLVFVSMVNTKINHFALLFGEQKLELPPSAHIRLQMEPTQARLAVLEGAIQVGAGSNAVDVPRKKTAVIPLTGEGEPQVAKNVSATDFDRWDHDAADYHKSFAMLNGNGASSSGFGTSDLAYYGSFVNAGGCGSMWRPHFASAAWDPFSNGTWAYYPNAGYSWVSPYPWAWTPYHSGSWSYCDGTGWGWLPGSTWNGLNNSPATLVSSGRGGSTTLPRPPNRPPVLGASTLVAVNLKPLTSSSLNGGESFTFRRDSAGLGIPRGTLGKLDSFSTRAVQRGSATTAIYMAVPGYSNDGAVAAGRSAFGYAPASSRTSAMPGYSAASSSNNSVSAVHATSGGMGGVSSGGGAGHPH